MVQQKTLKRTVECTGVGLHSGKQVRLRLHPSRRDTGISFVRSDLGGSGLRLKRARVVRADHATTVAGRRFSISTVEHLLAAIRILGIDNVVIEVDGPEIPIMDGSAAPFIYLIREAGVRRQAAFRSYLVVRESIEIQEDGRDIAIYPFDRLRVSYMVDFPGTFIGRQSITRTLYQSAFIEEFAPARTFCFLKDVEALRARGLALGGSLDNAVVVDDSGPMNRLRFEDEFVRHKVLDLVGDLALLGAPLLGHIVANKGGHSLHARLVEALRQADALESITFSGSRREEFAHAVAGAHS